MIYLFYVSYKIIIYFAYIVPILYIDIYRERKREENKLMKFYLVICVHSFIFSSGIFLIVIPWSASFKVFCCCCCCCCVASVVSDSVWPHRRQPTRLPRPWDSPGKNTGVGCHFLLQCMKVKSESEVAQSCPTLCNPMDYSLPGSSVHGIFQARVLEWGAIAFSLKYSNLGLII